jgi:hypothetical protein
MQAGQTVFRQTQVSFEATVSNKSNCCCCYCRLCCQVVAFQAMMEMMAETFPGAFSGYTLKVRKHVLLSSPSVCSSCLAPALHWYNAVQALQVGVCPGC